MLERFVGGCSDMAVEHCGLLVGSDGAIADLVAIPNVSASPASSFELDPAAHLAAARHAREQGKRIVGHYHSHPSGDASPSHADARRAREQGLYWLILGGGEARLWISRAGGSMLGAFEPVELEVG